MAIISGNSGGINPIHTPKTPNHGAKAVEVNLPTESFTLSGTGFAAPVVAGLAATMLQANPELTPSDVKDILTGTAGPGGVVNPEKALKASIPSSVEGANIAGVRPEKASAIKNPEDLSLAGVNSTSLHGLYSKKPIAQLGFGFASFD